jgi:hypothetical protein
MSLMSIQAPCPCRRRARLTSSSGFYRARTSYGCADSNPRNHESRRLTPLTVNPPPGFDHVAKALQKGLREHGPSASAVAPTTGGSRWGHHRRWHKASPSRSSGIARAA